jgi:sporulation integral membrane protein YlbJ
MNNFIVIAVLSILLIFLSINRKNSKIIYVKKLLLPILSVLFIISLILLSKTAVNSAIKGIDLWLNIVFPSLFPFFVASELLNKSGFIRAAGILFEPIMRPLFNVPGAGSFAFIMGITSGYPVGAKITSGLIEEKLINRSEAERLLAFTNNSGPLFIIGAVGVGMFNSSRIGILLLICHILACITVGILLRNYGKKSRVKQYRVSENSFKRFVTELKNARPGSNISSLFGDAIKNSITLILAIGGFIIFFSVVINLLLQTGFIDLIAEIGAVILAPIGFDKKIIASIASGFFEITTGANLVSKIDEIPLIHKLTAVSGIIGWAGISVHSQVASIMSSSGIRLKPYLLGKCLQGIISAIYTYTIIRISDYFAVNLVYKTTPAFSPSVYSNPDWADTFAHSLTYLGITLCTLLIIGLLPVLMQYSKKKQT